MTIALQPINLTGDMTRSDTTDLLSHALTVNELQQTLDYNLSAQVSDLQFYLFFTATRPVQDNIL